MGGWRGGEGKIAACDPHDCNVLNTSTNICWLTLTEMEVAVGRGEGSNKAFEDCDRTTTRICCVGAATRTVFLHARLHALAAHGRYCYFQLKNISLGPECYVMFSSCAPPRRPPSSSSAANTSRSVLLACLHSNSVRLLSGYWGACSTTVSRRPSSRTAFA